MEPLASVVEVQSLNHWTSREVPTAILKIVWEFREIITFTVLIWVQLEIYLEDNLAVYQNFKYVLILQFFPGELRGQRGLAGYSLWGCKELGQDWATNTFTYFHTDNTDMYLTVCWDSYHTSTFPPTKYSFPHFIDKEEKEVKWLAQGHNSYRARIRTCLQNLYSEPLCCTALYCPKCRVLCLVD